MALAVVLLCGFPKAMAQSDKNLFNHLSVGLSVGTDGLIGFDVATPIGNYVQARLGMSIMPEFSYSTDVDYWYEHHSKQGNVDVKGKLHKSDFKLLFDFFPFKSLTFHFTTGFFAGGEKLVSIKNTEIPPGVGPGDGLVIGKYLVGFDDEGIARGEVRVNGFKPYLGIGFGRAVPKKRISVMCDLGVQFWGKPAVYGYDSYESKWTKITSEDVDGDDGGAIKTLSKISVWPVINVRVGGLIF